MSGYTRTAAAIAVAVILSPLVPAGSALAADAKTAPVAAAKTPASSAKAAPGAAKPAAAKLAPVPAGVTAAQIVEKNLAARGGASAWKAVQAMQMSGTLEAGRGDSYQRSLAIFKGDKRFRGNKAVAEAAAVTEGKAEDKQVQLPFKLDEKRPHKSRLEIEFAGKTAVQVFDGEHGWKLRPFLNRTDAEPFTADETRSEAAQDDIEGPLFDYAAKGTKVAVEGVDKVEGNDAYKLKLTRKDGSNRYIWIDAKTFLDVKVQGTPKRMDAKMHDVFVMQRDFRKVQGVMIPFVIETSVDGYPETHKMIVEKAEVNPALDDALFTKPHA